MKIRVLNQAQAENETWTKPVAIISITGLSPADIKENENVHGILRLVFADQDPNRWISQGATSEDFAGLFKLHKLMTVEHGEQIKEFVDNHKNHVDEIVVHCEAGISRSAGVAVGLSLVHNGDDGGFYDTHGPNAFVKMMVMRAYGRRY
jgi:predicted protein tyrosine phosphatase